MLEFRILWRKIAPNPIKSGVDTGENNVALKKVRRLGKKKVALKSVR